MNMNLTDVDTKYIKENFSKKSIEDIAKDLNIKTLEVAIEAKRMNLKKRTLKKFTDEDIDILKKHYKYLSYGQLGNVLNRNRTVIFNKIKELGLSKEDVAIIEYKDSISGFEDSIMFLHTNNGYSVSKIKSLIDKHFSTNELSEEMIESFIFISKSDYEKQWKLFGKKI